ncbi:type II toxin-antitoxin system RelE/ParE family toxin [Pseudoduganella sp. LjRoot289]|uniref:type II toxin-antitoxin system RelE/ParE family toxin n=1 Tax=Pseudoduganella sp. LjRoot289 TaxID=3342314 RepID=UPI003ED11C07
MAHKLEIAWSASALEDLTQILDRIATDDPAAAAKFAAAVDRKTQQLVYFPKLGKPANHGVRELVVHRNYVLSYRLAEAGVEILQIWHVARAAAPHRRP